MDHNTFAPSGYIQRAQGKFTTWLMPDTPHCGPKSADHLIRDTFGYVVEIKFAPDALDDKGFLLDNLWFAQYFDNLQDVRIAISCEKLAGVIASDICREIGPRACACDAVSVTLEPIVGVTVCCIYRKQQIPQAQTALPVPARFPSLHDIYFPGER